MIRFHSRLLTGLAAAAALLCASPGSAPVLTAAHLDHCFAPSEHGAATVGARSANPRAGDHRSISKAQQATIESETKKRLARRKASGAGPVTIRVYVHVMESSTGAGNVSDSRIDRQIDVLNQTYSGKDADHPGGPDTGFRFRLIDVDRYRNSTWHTDGDSETYRDQTRRGTRTALNVWLVDFDYLGIATFPWDYAAEGDVDGVRIQYTSLPGGSATHYNSGKTLTHETGHWLGLYHTFQDGCSSPGDEVSDTPAQASPSTGCPTGRDSCSSRGLDPIHDYMDYSYDSCYQSFTPGQVSRMKQMWAAYRA
ncbi:zinc metalloprotease [Nocardioides marmorisolisilvae]|uniref:Zinc metalloprotease n=1 Tax=Nocardioides marmorisolisilvae TaxID=1542737 RepID=A0A3N0DWD1_9ACTN|nr:zinc metalloprotease [Nocardioides marmorisolisilvae]RNL79806.1 zinc metalloprotease [Nocardioides marmorisolisilvae]